MVSTYLTRSPKKITTRNTFARKIYTASRWVCLQHSGTNMYQSHWKSSSFPSFEVKKNTKSEWNQHPHSRSFFWTIQNSSFQSACGLWNLWVFPDIQVLHAFRSQNGCQNGAKDEAKGVCLATSPKEFGSLFTHRESWSLKKKCLQKRSSL